MQADLSVRAARPGDADIAADFAETRRAEYERYSPIFWRRAADARERHAPFLRSCLESADYAAFAAVRGAAVVGVILAHRHGAPPPFRDDPEPMWFVDDFYLAPTERWESAGVALLGAVTEAARAGGASRILVVGAQRDLPNRTFLLGAGYTVAAAWWAHPVTPASVPLPASANLRAIVTPAPPVYDPGGLTALALSLGETPAIQVALFDAWAAASHAVLAIVPARASDTALAQALAAHGYTVASEWYSRAV